MRFLSLTALALVVPSLLPIRVRADTLSGTKSSEMFDRAHTIEIRIERGHATFVISRTFENRSGKHDQAMLDITDLPDGAVATGLRTLGGDANKPIWYAAELLDAEVAAKKYRELTGIGGYYPKDPALLSWRSQGHLKLQVFPVAPKSQKTVELTLEAPTKYIDGKHVIEVPSMGTSLSPNIVFKGDGLSIDGASVPSGETRRHFGAITVGMVPSDPPGLGGRFASVSFGKGRALLHTAIEIAPKVSQLPKGAYVVVVLDGSRSLNDAARQAEIAATRAYLQNLPDAKVQVLVFDRNVRPLQPLHKDFMSVAQALDDLKLTALSPKNGSNLDLALAEAAKRIVTAPSGAPRRILAITDLATRSTLLPSQVKGLDATKAVVHLATVAPGEPGASRDDFDPWATVARATGGLLWRAQVGADVAKNKHVLEEWARPLRIDRIAVTGVGITSSNAPDSLAEGEGFDDLVIQAFAAPSIEVKGELWSTPISTVLTTTPSEERLWSALAIGSDLLHELKDPEITTLAFKGSAVSPMTSFLAVEPGVRPSTEGLEWGGGGLGLSGIGFGGGGSGIGIGLGKPSIDRAKIVREKVAAIAAACGTSEITAHLETTWTEIVAADVVAKTDALKSCVVEGIYGIDLPSVFNASWQKWDVSIGN